VVVGSGDVPGSVEVAGSVVSVGTSVVVGGPIVVVGAAVVVAGPTVVVGTAVVVSFIGGHGQSSKGGSMGPETQPSHSSIEVQLASW
jgi:hypothetical protein